MKMSDLGAAECFDRKCAGSQYMPTDLPVAGCAWVSSRRPMAPVRHCSGQWCLRGLWLSTVQSSWLSRLSCVIWSSFKCSADLANPKTNSKTAGFTKEEREGFTNLLNEGFVDSFRHLYPDQTGSYSYWTYMGNARAKNVGWYVQPFTWVCEIGENVATSAIPILILMERRKCPSVCCSLVII